MAKMMLLVIDSFGIGATDDCEKYEEPANCTANTYKRIREEKGDILKIPTLYSLGLGTLVDDKPSPDNAYGYSKLVHHPAETYLGHQEIAGSIPKKANKRLMKDIHRDMKRALQKKGYDVRYPFDDNPVLRSEEHTSELQSRFDLVCR